MGSCGKTRHLRGFTLIEMMVVIALAGVMTLGVGIFLANGQRNWNRLFGRVYGETAIDGFAAHKAFDSVCRKASTRKYVIGDSFLYELHEGLSCDLLDVNTRKPICGFRCACDVTP